MSNREQGEITVEATENSVSKKGLTEESRRFAKADLEPL